MKQILFAIGIAVVSSQVLACSGENSSLKTGAPDKATSTASFGHFEPVQPTRSLLNTRSIQSGAKVTKEQVRDSALKHAHLFSPSIGNGRFKTTVEKIASKKMASPSVVSIELSNYDDFNLRRNKINGKRLEVDNFPVWIVEIKGQFAPISHAMKSSKISATRLLLAYTESGDLISRIEVSEERWKAAQAK